MWSILCSVSNYVLFIDGDREHAYIMAQALRSYSEYTCHSDSEPETLRPVVRELDRTALKLSGNMRASASTAKSNVTGNMYTSVAIEGKSEGYFVAYNAL